MIRPKLLTVGGDTGIYIGEAEFLTPGTYTFKVPLSVSRIHACCIGAGAQGGAGNISMDWHGGGGGGLGWKNNIEVTPGEEITVVVGAVVGEGLATNGDSYVETANGKVVSGNSPNPNDWTQGGTFTGDGGGAGGSGSVNESDGGTLTSKGSGGGAGGYRGNGGSGTVIYAVQGGNGGGGSGGASEVKRSGGSVPGARGGGTGLNGEGASGASPRTANVPVGDDAPRVVGNAGSGGNESLYGAGGAGERNGWDGQDETKAGHGGVRIIWGNKFSYPDNADVIE